MVQLLSWDNCPQNLRAPRFAALPRLIKMAVLGTESIMRVRFLGLLLMLSVVGSNVIVSEPSVVWEVFIDPLCRNCKAGWPVITQVAERYHGSSSLAIVVHPFPAPFHHNAFFTARALHIVQMMNASSLVYPLLELVFKNQETFSNPSTKFETPAHVITRLVSLTGELGISATSFEAGFNDAATDEATRISFKYGCSRGVVGTPTYLVNGVTVVGANDAWSVEDWASTFDHMVKATNHSTQS